MRKIIAVEFITLDGVMQAPGASKEDASEGFKYGGWMGPYFDEAGGKEMNKQMKKTYALLLGRKTYDIFVGYWPKNIEPEKGWPQVNKITKYVVSKTLKNLPAGRQGQLWENTVILRNIEELKKIKKENGKDMQVYGSSNLLQGLMKNDLVDEFWLKIFPITLGSGKKLFEKGTIPASFKLFKSKITPSGVIFAYYKRAGDVKTEDIV